MQLALSTANVHLLKDNSPSFVRIPETENQLQTQLHPVKDLIRIPSTIDIHIVLPLGFRL